MFFSRISGLWQENKYIFIRAEYSKIKFHINEIREIQIADRSGIRYTTDDLPVRNATLHFLLKSGRTKTCFVRKLTKRRYKHLTSLLAAR